MYLSTHLEYPNYSGQTSNLSASGGDRRGSKSHAALKNAVPKVQPEKRCGVYSICLLPAAPAQRGGKVCLDMTVPQIRTGW